MDDAVAALLAKPQWRDERQALRTMLLACGLSETVKWGNLCYTHSDANIAMIYAIKAYCGVSFFKGALMTDPEGLLYQRSEQMQAARLYRFTSLAEVMAGQKHLARFVVNAVAIEAAGLKVAMMAKDELIYPQELQDMINCDDAFAAAFDGLTAGRKRGYVLHIAGAKQAVTRLARIEANVTRILAGKGIYDCICGLSKRPPRCDGAHRQLET